MPIHVESSECEHPILLYDWTVVDLDRLADIVAHLLLGRVNHVQKLLNGSEVSVQQYRNRGIDEAINRVLLPGVRADDVKIFHRDGWLFQFISWIVCTENEQMTVVRMPQARPADKGFDGIFVELNGSAIASVSISEDKATDNPRKTITKDVWPEFEDYEQGNRDNELTIELSALLSQKPGIDIDVLIQSTDWLDQKLYRASVATSRQNLPVGIHTYKGYDTVILGVPERRTANLFLHDDMRQFFVDLSTLVVAKLEAMRPTQNV